MTGSTVVATVATVLVVNSIRLNETRLKAAWTRPTATRPNKTSVQWDHSEMLLHDQTDHALVSETYYDAIQLLRYISTMSPWDYDYLNYRDVL